MVRKKKGKAQKQNRQVAPEEGPEVVEAPHSFVLHRGLACPYIQDLTKDFRRIMEPFTAINLKERKANKIKDFVSLSGHFHVSHMCIFNKATTQLSFKVVRLPRGPTLTYKIHQFTLARDVIASSRKQFVDEDSFHHPPLVIMNNFAGEGKHLKLMATTFQNMFPAINLATVNLATIKRCVLFSYNPTTKLVDMRHYSVIAVPVGLSRAVKKVVMGKIPNLSRCDDITDVFTGGAISDSEFEDDEASHVVLPQDLKRKGNLENNKSALRLYEIGPRLTFELIKIEDGLLTGEVLYHETVVKSDVEVEQIRRQREKKKRLKEYRKKVQNENKAKKNDFKSDKKRAKRIDETIDEAPDDDAEYYRQEVGEEPDEELFKKDDSQKRKKAYVPKYMQAKRRKLEKAKKLEGKGDEKWRGKGDRDDRNERNSRNDRVGKNSKFKTKKFGFKTKPGMPSRGTKPFKKGKYPRK